jgi:hypothetical protein
MQTHKKTSQCEAFVIGGAQGRNRTTDTRIFNPLLYRLSYLGMAEKCKARIKPEEGMRVKIQVERIRLPRRHPRY